MSVRTFSEAHDVAPPRMVLTTRAVRWAVERAQLRRHHRLGAGPASGVDWHTAWNAIEVEAEARAGDPDRLSGREDPWRG